MECAHTSPNNGGSPSQKQHQHTSEVSQVLTGLNSRGAWHTPVRTADLPQLCSQAIVQSLHGVHLYTTSTTEEQDTNEGQGKTLARA